MSQIHSPSGERSPRPPRSLDPQPQRGLLARANVGHARSLHRRAECGAAVLVIAELVEARRRRRQQHGVARARIRRRVADRALQRPALGHRHRRPSAAPRTPARPRRSYRRGRHGRNTACRRRGRAPLARPPTIQCTRVERAERRRGAFRIGRLAVVDKRDPAPLADLLHPVRQPAKALQPASMSALAHAQQLADRDRRQRVLRIVRPLQRRPARLVHAHARRDLVEVLAPRRQRPRDRRRRRIGQRDHRVVRRPTASRTAAPCCRHRPGTRHNGRGGRA